MALTEPRRSTFEIRELALARALQLHGVDLPDAVTPPDTALATAKAFEDYLTGPTPTARVEGDSTTAGRPLPSQTEVDEAQEQWRINVENLPLDGEPKMTLNSEQVAYRIEALARLLLTDPHETAANRQAALDELRSTVNGFVDVLEDGAPE